jgi:predicted  nucleic acid-binding Zn-ribbon protein
VIFRCRNCGETTADIDAVLDGSCACGCTSFQLVSENAAIFRDELSAKEAIRRDLHMWVDLNIDSANPEDLTNLRVRFEFNRPESDGQSLT